MVAPYGDARALRRRLHLARTCGRRHVLLPLERTGGHLESRNGVPNVSGTGINRGRLEVTLPRGQTKGTPPVEVTGLGPRLRRGAPGAGVQAPREPVGMIRRGGTGRGATQTLTSGTPETPQGLVRLTPTVPGRTGRGRAPMRPVARAECRQKRKPGATGVPGLPSQSNRIRTGKRTQLASMTRQPQGGLNDGTPGGQVPRHPT